MVEKQITARVEGQVACIVSLAMFAKFHVPVNLGFEAEFDILGPDGLYSGTKEQFVGPRVEAIRVVAVPGFTELMGSHCKGP